MLQSLVHDFPFSDQKLSLLFLEKFIDKHSAVFSFDQLNGSDKSVVWGHLFTFLANNVNSGHRIVCLSCIKILSRDPKLLKNPDFSESYLVQIVDCAKANDDSNDSLNVAVEADKCLCNILKNSQSCQNIFFSINGIEPMLNRIVCTSERTLYSLDLKLFDLRLLFLVSALNVPFRNKLSREINGLAVLVRFFQQILVEKSKISRRLISSCNDTEVLIISEILKILFNILNCCHVDVSNSVLPLLCEFLREILLLPVHQGSPRYKLQIDVINLITVLPFDSCIQLIAPINLSQHDVSIDDPLMVPAKTVLNILDIVLTDFESKKNTSQEMLSPLLMALLNLSKSHRLYRKYFRKLVLPPLRDVFKRPEEGKTLRNKLCRLFTSPVTSVSDLAASWLFILCKEKVSRMVKYTGYGNSAGLFARHGFPTENDEYSSDSESDTEEYLANKEEINPVVGCKMVRPPEVAMSDEQKEHFAIELLDSIDKLQRGGIIQPCTIGADGKPKPIEHVLQLRSGKDLIHDISDEDDD